LGPSVAFFRTRTEISMVATVTLKPRAWGRKSSFIVQGGAMSGDSAVGTSSAADASESN